MEKENSCNLTNKEATIENYSAELNQNRKKSNIAFGWGRYRPKCLQFLNNSKWFLVAVIAYTVSQGTVVLGLANFVLPSIERRFSFSSKELGIIVSASDVSALLLVVIISFYGGYGNKIRWIGGGAILTGIGILIFSIPHFIVGRYKPVDVRTSGLCLITNTTINQDVPLECNNSSGGEWYYLIIFVIAQMIIGGGLSPFYSLLPAYLDENVELKSVSVYLGIWYTFTFVAPGLGYLIGGKFLSIYVDIEQPAGLNLTPMHPNWIGAWWLGFIIFGLATLVCSVIFLGFPEEMPGAKERRLEHIRQGHLLDVDGEEKPRLRDLLPELKNLFTNGTFIFNALGIAASLLYASSVAVFISKIFRLKFGLDPVNSGYVLSILTVTGVGLGNLFGSVAVRIFSIKEACKKAALVCLICNVIATFGPLIFFIPGCMNSNLAGIANPYYNGTSSGQLPTIPSVNDSPLRSLCNTNCHCSLGKFSPICGSDSVTYFDACHAGCTAKLPNMTFTNCSCIPGSSTKPSRGGLTKPGYCDRKCKNVILFAALTSLILVIQFSSVVPGRLVILRCVPDNKRAFSAGIHFVLFKTLGLLPGPIIFGHLTDMTCRLWQNSCGKKGRCFDYDIEELSRTICFFGIAVSSLATIFYFLSWYFCKPHVQTGMNPGDQVIENPGANLRSPEDSTYL